VPRFRIPDADSLEFAFQNLRFVGRLLARVAAIPNHVASFTSTSLSALLTKSAIVERLGRLIILADSRLSRGSGVQRAIACLANLIGNFPRAASKMLFNAAEPAARALSVSSPVCAALSLSLSLSLSCSRNVFSVSLDRFAAGYVPFL